MENKGATKQLLVILGSPRKEGNSSTLAARISQGAKFAGAKVETLFLQDLKISPCRGCDTCQTHDSKGCAIKDDMQEIYPKLIKADAWVIASPVYWFTMSAQTKIFMDRCYALPADTGNITYYFDEFVTDGCTMVEIRGWAFVWGHDSLDNEKYIVLKSADRTYVFTTETMIKEGVTQYFEELGLNLDYSGFRALVPARKVANGEYTVGIYITKDDIKALMYTNKTIIKSGDTIKAK